MPKNLSEVEWRWKHFSRSEMACKGSGECCMDEGFMDLLEAIRVDYGKPMIVTSGYRSPEYNAQVSHTGHTGPHTTGRAADIAIRGKDAYTLLRMALAHGMTGIGISQKGSSRFIHIDNLEAPDFPRPMLWSY